MKSFKFMFIIVIFTTSIFADKAQVEGFVERFYVTVLDRNSEEAGLNYWTNGLLSGQEAGADIARGFIFSGEFTNQATTNDEFLDILYRAFFNREPDDAGLKAWIDYLDRGRERDFILNGFLYSQEFYNLCEEYGIEPIERNPNKDYVSSDDNDEYELLSYKEEIYGTIYTPPSNFVPENFTLIENGEEVDIDKMCSELISENSSLIGIDLSNPKVKEIHDILKESDINNGYQIFLRKNATFMSWINNNSTLSTAIHETNHAIDGKIEYCNPNDIAKYFSLGHIYITDLKYDDTKHYSIVEETIPEKLKIGSRYELYIEGTKKASANRFNVLLDELNAYTGDAWFQVNFRRSGLPKESKYYTTSQFQIDGVIDFMIYLEYYLKSARLNYPDTYNKIISQPNTIKYIQYIWIKAEEVIEASYIYITDNKYSKYIFFKKNLLELSARDKLKEIYLDDAISELDLIEIEHTNYNHWQKRYFNYDFSH